MNTFNTLQDVYENMLTESFLLEGKQQSIQFLKSKNIDDAIIDKIINMDKTNSKSDSIRLGSYFLETNNIANVEQYYNKFLELKKKGKTRDINQYKTFEELENFIDQLEKKEGSVSVKGEETSEDIKKERVYFDDNVDIYYADTVQKSCKYGHSLGQSYPFCISRTGSGNMFLGYRTRQESNFYFCLFKNRSNNVVNGEYEDPSHMVVLDVTPRGLMWTWADNGSQGHGTKDTDWDEVLSQFPELQKPYDDGLFQEKRLTSEEKSKINKFNAVANSRSLEAFLGLSYDEKKEYIVSAFELSIEMFKTLDKNLRNEFVNIGHQLSEDFYNELNPSEKDRWSKTRLAIISQGI